ncbi:hypothetical protein QBC46DRAFT_391204 [Diplogelasinospora grovesii]|uniref:Uncharacterized protein n=1 Tax=Diplogelasinospora grovesii TaxID=303347 RepID=A0AAN6N440_9PEZI|nr:hypothetical protein QBC46DRAFT_391204 [Diplogelasinospora grovesii]
MAGSNQGANNGSNHDDSRSMVDVRLIPDHDSPKDPQEWLAIIQFHCRDLPQLMREGLFWTTSNVLPEFGFYEMLGGKGDAFAFKREWKLKEFVDKLEAQCRWFGSVVVYAHAVQTLSTF